MKVIKIIFCIITATFLVVGIPIIINECYARQNPGVGRIQLIRMAKDISGKNRFKRLDMSMSAVRDKVSKAINNDELDHIFDTDGFFM